MMLCAIDFEFKRPADPDMGLISCALQVQGCKPETYWLFDGTQHRDLIERLETLKGYVMVGYSIQQAEARCFAALKLDPNQWKWRDLMLEWRWLRNGDYRYSYGPCMVNGQPIRTFPPKVRVGKRASQEELEAAKEENDSYLEDLSEELGSDVGLSEVGLSMLDCSYFFGVVTPEQYREAESVKKRVRDEIIIKGSNQDVLDHMDEVLTYNAADISDLLALAKKITTEMQTIGEEAHCLMYKGCLDYTDMDARQIHAIQLDMGDWAARLAKYAQRGIPLHKGRLKRLLEVVPKLTQEAKDSWNRTYPETPLYRVGFSASMLEPRTIPLRESPYVKGSVTKDDTFLEGIIQAYCDSTGNKAYPRTRTGKPDTSKKVISRYASGDNILKQYERHQGTLSSLKTYSPNSEGEVEALRYIGRDGKQRPDFGPFGTQTARNAAKAKSFCFLGPHWLRILVDPEPGKAIVSCDFGAEEFLIAAIQGNDPNMEQAYLSVDPYLYYAQLVGMYPAHLPIPTEEQRSEEWFAPYKKVRQAAKALTLSMQFGAGAASVVAAVRDATGDRTIPDEKGEEWISDYRSAYPDYAYWVSSVKSSYKAKISFMLPGGWRMGPDNPSIISASNLPIQGTGSVILQEACKRMDAEGLKVIATLHDDITLYCDEKDAEKVGEQATQIMQDAAAYVLGKRGMKVGHAEIIRHGELWLHSDRAKAAWNKLAVYFEGTVKK